MLVDNDQDQEVSAWQTPAILMTELNDVFKDASVTLYVHDIMMNRRATPWYARVSSSAARMLFSDTVSIESCACPSRC